MSRRRDRHGLQVAHGERYALIPREVLTSEAYRALPAWTPRVLLGLAVQFYGSRNGSLALPHAEAQSLGISTPAQLYGGLKLLETVGLITCCRRGALTAGGKLASLYALTWKPINEPPPEVIYDGTIVMTLRPSHAWAKWAKPGNWDEQVRIITARARGQLGRACPYTKKKSSTQREERLTHSVSKRGSRSRTQREERDSPILAHSVCVTSKISAPGTASDAWTLALRLRNPAFRFTAVTWLLIALTGRPA